MFQLDLTADALVSALLQIAATEPVCILDSCGVGYLDSHLLIAGVKPVSVEEINSDLERTLDRLDRMAADHVNAAIFTLSYDLGKRLLNMGGQQPGQEPDIYLARFAVLIVHDYRCAKTYLTGDPQKFEGVAAKLRIASEQPDAKTELPRVRFRSNFTRDEYLERVQAIQEQIRAGNTYQTNLTQQLSAVLSPDVSPEQVFQRLRHAHPAAFAAYLKRPGSTVISASPERFVSIDLETRRITTSPVKGTRPRGDSDEEDRKLREELLASSKDRAENTMIVDLLRNDIGRVAEYGSVVVERLCEIETHPTFFHLVSTITGQLRADAAFSDMIRALFPCGSITGAPKISTMKIIDELETADRGLSMGAIGCYLPASFGFGARIETSVTIRTMVIRDSAAVFNVGGGITIDSDPASEYEESLTKAKALLLAANGTLLAGNKDT